MTDRRLFVHAETPDAILVSTTPYYDEAERKGGWLPRSEVAIRARRVAYNPRHNASPGATLILGTVLDLSAPDWLLDERGITSDADVPDSYFAAPQCPHGEPLSRACRGCVREHQEATA